ncbi:hypothetical protein [Rhizobium sp.]
MLITLQWISIMAAFIAAFFWFWSAIVPIPSIRMTLMNKDGSITRPPHEAAFRKQSKMNALGAMAGAIAAIAQGTSFYLTLPISN